MDIFGFKTRRRAPTLSAGEVIIDQTTGDYKVGDGKTPTADLPSRDDDGAYIALVGAADKEPT